MRLLMVEDDSLLRHLLCRRLAAHGHEVDLAATPDEALRLSEEGGHDLAIVDLGLPRQAGVALIRTLRQQGHGFPILVLTAHGRWQVKMDALRDGADDYLNKPFVFDELDVRLNALLERCQARPATGGAMPLRAPVKAPEPLRR